MCASGYRHCVSSDSLHNDSHDQTEAVLLRPPIKALSHICICYLFDLKLFALITLTAADHVSHLLSAELLRGTRALGRQ